MQITKRYGRGKLPFLQKCVAMNMIADCSKFIRTSGMNPQVSSMQEKWAPHMRLATQHILESNINVVENFEKLRSGCKLNEA